MSKYIYFVNPILIFRFANDIHWTVLWKKGEIKFAERINEPEHGLFRLFLSILNYEIESKTACLNSCCAALGHRYWLHFWTDTFPRAPTTFTREAWALSYKIDSTNSGPWQKEQNCFVVIITQTRLKSANKQTIHHIACYTFLQDVGVIFDGKYRCCPLIWTQLKV